MTKNKLREILPLSIFMVTFFVVESLRLYVVHEKVFNLDKIFSWTLPTVLRLFTWTLPAFLFVYFVLKQNPLDYLKLRSNLKNGLLFGVAISTVHIAVHCGIYYFFKGCINVHWGLSYNAWLQVIIMAGFFEEILFRGLVLQRLREVFNFKSLSEKSAHLKQLNRCR